MSGKGKEFGNSGRQQLLVPGHDAFDGVRGKTYFAFQRFGLVAFNAFQRFDIGLEFQPLYGGFKAFWVNFVNSTTRLLTPEAASLALSPTFWMPEAI